MWSNKAKHVQVGAHIKWKAELNDHVFVLVALAEAPFSTTEKPRRRRVQKRDGVSEKYKSKLRIRWNTTLP